MPSTDCDERDVTSYVAGCCSVVGAAPACVDVDAVTATCDRVRV